MNRLLSSLFVDRQNSTKRGVWAARNRSNRRRQFHLGVECMEGRQLMSATTLTAVPIGTLHVAMPAEVGDNDVDLILNQNVADGKVLPTTTPYYLQINGEVMAVLVGPAMSVSNVAVNNEYDIIVSRAADGTTLTAHPVNETVSWLDGYLPATHLGAPTGFEAKAVSTSQIDLSWDDVIGSNGYTIQQWNGTSSWTTIKTVGGASMDYDVPSLNPGTTYYFRVAAFNDDGPGDYTNYLSATTAKAVAPVTPPKPTIPGTPKDFTATAVSTSQINLSWTGVSGATGYVVYKDVNNAWQKLGTTTGTNCAVPGLSPDTTYWFDVAATNAAGTSAGAVAFATTLEPVKLEAPGAPTNLAAKAASSTQINLSWTGVSGATGYVVYKYTSSGWQSIGTTTATSCGVTSLSPGTGYYFEVAAYNSAGTGKPSSYTYALTTPGAPPFKAQAVSTSEAELSWSPVASATGYLVELYENGAWKELGNPLSASTTSCLVTGLGVGTYYFEVVAFNSSGVGAFPMWQSATT